jgi:hypothetical protein
MSKIEDEKDKNPFSDTILSIEKQCVLLGSKGIDSIGGLFYGMSYLQAKLEKERASGNIQPFIIEIDPSRIRGIVIRRDDKFKYSLNMSRDEVVKEMNMSRDEVVKEITKLYNATIKHMKLYKASTEVASKSSGPVLKLDLFLGGTMNNIPPHDPNCRTEYESSMGVLMIPYEPAYRMCNFIRDSGLYRDYEERQDAVYRMLGDKCGGTNGFNVREVRISEDGTPVTVFLIILWNDVQRVLDAAVNMVKSVSGLGENQVVLITEVKNRLESRKEIVVSASKRSWTRTIRQCLENSAVTEVMEDEAMEEADAERRMTPAFLYSIPIPIEVIRAQLNNETLLKKIKDKLAVAISQEEMEQLGKIALIDNKVMFRCLPSLRIRKEVTNIVRGLALTHPLDIVELTFS